MNIVLMPVLCAVVLNILTSSLLLAITFTLSSYILMDVFTVFFSDQDQKSESSSEVAHRDDSQASTRDQSEQQSSQSAAAGDGGQVSGSESLKKPQPPDMADRSSQSSFTSLDGTGNC